MAKGKKPSGGWSSGVPTNYGYATLADGTKVTFLLQVDGTGIVQTPDSLKGRIIYKVSGVWTLKG